MGGFRTPAAPTNIGESLKKGLKDVRDASLGMFKAKQQKTEMKAINTSDKVVQAAWLEAQKAETDDMQEVFKEALEKGFDQLAKDTGIASNSVMLENVRIEFDAKVNRQQARLDASQMKRTADELVSGYDASIDAALNDWREDLIDKSELDIRLERTYMQMKDGIGTAFHSESEVRASIESTRKYVLGRMDSMRDEKKSLAISELKVASNKIKEDLDSEEITASEALSLLEELEKKTISDGRFETPEEAEAIFIAYGRATWGIEGNLRKKENEEIRVSHRVEIEKINLEEKKGDTTAEQATKDRDAVLVKMRRDNDSWDSDAQLELDFLSWSNPPSITRDKAAEARRGNLATLTQGIRSIESAPGLTIQQRLDDVKALGKSAAATGSFITEAELSNHIDAALHGVIVGSVQAQIAEAESAQSKHEPNWRENAMEALDRAVEQIDEHESSLTNKEVAALRSMVAGRKEALKETVNDEVLEHLDSMAIESNAGDVGGLTALRAEAMEYLKTNAWDLSPSQMQSHAKKIIRNRTEMLLSSMGGKTEAEVRENADKLANIYRINGGDSQNFKNIVINRVGELRRKGAVALYNAAKKLREDPGIYNTQDDTETLRYVEEIAKGLYEHEGHLLPEVRKGGGTSVLGDKATVDEIIDELIKDNILYAYDNLSNEKNVELAEKLLKVYDREPGKNTIPEINKLRGEIAAARDSVTEAERQSNYQFGLLKSSGTEGLAQLGGKSLEKLNTMIENSGDNSLHIKYANNTGVITPGLLSRYNALMSKEQANYTEAFALLDALKPFQAKQLSGMSQGMFPGGKISERLSWMYLNMGDDERTLFIKSLDAPGQVEAYSEAYADIWIAFNSGKIYTGGQPASEPQETGWNDATLALRNALSTTGGAFDTNQMLLFLQPAVSLAADDIMKGGGIVSTPEQRIERINKLAGDVAKVVSDNYVDLVTEDHKTEMFTGNLLPKNILEDFYGAGFEVLWEEGGALFQEDSAWGDTETMVFENLESIEGQGNMGDWNQKKNILGQRSFVLDMQSHGKLLVIPVFESQNTITPTGFFIYEKDGTAGSDGMRSFNQRDNSYFSINNIGGKSANDLQNTEVFLAATVQYDEMYSNKNGMLEAYTSPPMPGTPISFTQAQGKYRVAVSNITPMSNEVEYAAQILFAARRDGWGIQTSVYPVDWDDGKIKAVHSRYQQLLNPGP